jgi:hypothetical protein
MIIEFLVSKFFFLVMLAAAFGAYIGMTRFHNWSIGLGWSKDIWPAIKDDPRAVSDYFRTVRLGMWIGIGLAILAGAIS